MSTRSRSDIEATSAADPEDLDTNRSSNAHLRDLLDGPLSRRNLLRGGAGALAAAALHPLAWGADDDTKPVSASPTKLGFDAVPKSLADALIVPAGYTATVLCATGDSIDPAVGDYRNDGSDVGFSRRSGDQHDGMEYFGLSASGSVARLDARSTDRALLATNHESVFVSATFLHARGQTNIDKGARPEAEAMKEIEAHGVSIVEIRKTKDTNGKFVVQKASAYNRRITASTPVDLHGPLRGHALAKTRYSPDGLATRGTLNNCSAGRTPWGTYLTCEENWAGYFRRRAGDDAARTAKEVASLQRVGLMQGWEGYNRWASVEAADRNSTEFSRWDASATGSSAADDFRNEPNIFGWPVEIDPLDPKSKPRKRTALGRFAHEGATCCPPVAGRPLAFYMGDDSRSEYIYKFVSKANWDAADVDRGGMSTGDKYLDEGTLYVARFNADGTGRWLRLDLSNPRITSHGAYAFADLADVVCNARIAADAAGATRMDRPEWTAVNPKNGEIYVTLTENPNRGGNTPVDAANPRYWLDTRAGTSQQRGNVNGHIIRMRETAGHASAETFDWDIFLFGAQARADAGLDDANYQKHVNLSGLSDFNDLSKPDGCKFSSVSGILWIETDDNTYTDESNCMLLAAIPGRVGDGASVTIVNKADGKPGAVTNTSDRADISVTTRMGRKMNDTIFKRFLTAPKGAEVTGIAESPDGKVLFVNIQHPGEDMPADRLSNPESFQSHWPGNGAGLTLPHGAGGAMARPRSATVMITKNDGGIVGL